MPVKKIKKLPAQRKIVKKRTVKKTAKPAALKKKKPARLKLKTKIIGTITHYFPKVRAAVIKLKAPLSVGDNIRIKGHTTNFTQIADSIQIDKIAINSAKKGQEIGLLVNSRVRQGDIVNKL